MDVCLPLSGNQWALKHRQERTCRHRYEEGRRHRRVGIGFPTKKYIHRHHPREPPSGGSPASRSAHLDGSLASTSKERKHDHYARSRHLSLDERSNTLATITVDRFRRLGREGSEFIDQLATSVVAGRHGGAMAMKDICKENHLHIPSVTSQVAISRRVHPYKFALRDGQAARGNREDKGG